MSIHDDIHNRISGTYVAKEVTYPHNRVVYGIRTYRTMLMCFYMLKYARNYHVLKKYYDMTYGEFCNAFDDEEEEPGGIPNIAIVGGMYFVCIQNPKYNDECVLFYINSGRMGNNKKTRDMLVRLTESIIADESNFTRLIVFNNPLIGDYTDKSYAREPRLKLDGGLRSYLDDLGSGINLTIEVLLSCDITQMYSIHRSGRVRKIEIISMHNESGMDVDTIVNRRNRGGRMQSCHSKYPHKCAHLKKVFDNDIIVRIVGARMGDVIKYTTSSITAGATIVYRIVSNHRI